MMNGMISVVEAEVIERLASKVACKVELGAHIAPVVLKEVQREDAVFGVELWQQREPYPSTPI
jgi:uncharacterized protein YeaC (DUF1315 family)